MVRVCFCSTILHFVLHLPFSHLFFLLRPFPLLHLLFLNLILSPIISIPFVIGGLQSARAAGKGQTS